MVFSVDRSQGVGILGNGRKKNGGNGGKCRKVGKNRAEGGDTMGGGVQKFGGEMGKSGGKWGQLGENGGKILEKWGDVGKNVEIRERRASQLIPNPSVGH